MQSGKSRQRVASIVAVGLLSSLLPVGPASAVPVPAQAVPVAAPAAAIAEQVNTGLAANVPASTTSAKEAKRVDRVRVSKVKWRKAGDRSGYSATIKLPLDYDKPTGAKVRVALFKVPAADRANRIGTLFVNPGGPGGSGVALARSASTFLSQDILNRFDIVGFDPRGTNGSTQVRCFSSAAKQEDALTGMTVVFPVDANQEKKYLASAKKLSKACSSRGRKLASAMSTAEVARDLDVLRRTLDGKSAKLSYLGFSYGTYLGEVYASLFPDRFRTMALDGVVDPTAWVGNSSTAGSPTTVRIRAAEGTWQTLQTGLERCAAKGPQYCPLTDPKADFDRVAAGLLAAKNHTIEIVDDGGKFQFSYAEFISAVLGLLYYPNGMDFVAELIAQLDDLLYPTNSKTLSRAGKNVMTLVKSYQRAVRTQSVLIGTYDNELDAYSGVICTDTREPRWPGTWQLAATRVDATAPHFGRLWAWSDVQCATQYWKAKDEDVFRGSFTQPTAAPVLLVGNYQDPATNYANAVQTAQLLPNSYLLSSDSWGHTAYGTSACVTSRIDAYLLTGAQPDGTVCTGDEQPFSSPLESASNTASGLAKDLTREGLPPVEPPIAG